MLKEHIMTAKSSNPSNLDPKIGEPINKRFCPIGFLWNGELIPGVTFCREDCMWYATLYQGTDNERTECAIASLFCLNDTAY